MPTKASQLIKDQQAKMTADIKTNNLKSIFLNKHGTALCSDQFLLAIVFKIMTLFREKFKTVYLCPVEHLYFWKNNVSYLGKEVGIDSK